MSHKEERDFCTSVKHKFPYSFKGKRVLEVGSGDINGNNNYLFEDCCLTRVDVCKGPNVDIVSYAHDLTFVDDLFDTVISTECFEHDKHYVKSLQNMVRMLRPGGLLLFTCATTGRPEHGTSRSKPWQVLSTRMENSEDYYKNLTEQDIREVIDVDKVFIEHEFSAELNHCDLFFWGIKK
tara:strand:- start:7954 stop:8493 length:540 start_codon:yes stop_codon:yes gene_type:complete